MSDHLLLWCPICHVAVVDPELDDLTEIKRDSKIRRFYCHVCKVVVEPCGFKNIGRSEGWLK